MNALGSVVDMYAVPSLKKQTKKKPLACFGVRAAYDGLLTLSDLINLIQVIFNSYNIKVLFHSNSSLVKTTSSSKGSRKMY